MRNRRSDGGFGYSLEIIHCLISIVTKPSIAIMTREKAFDRQSLDNKPFDIIFMINTPEQGVGQHLQALAKLAGFLGKG